MRNILSLRWLATRALVLALVMWVLIIGMIRLSPASEAAPPGEFRPFISCLHEDYRVCVYDHRHPKEGFDWSPWNFYVGYHGKVWRLPHDVAHDLTGAPNHRTYQPCASDGQDHGPCVWRANVRGNHLGQSYYLGRWGGVWPMPHHVAYQLVLS